MRLSFHKIHRLTSFDRAKIEILLNRGISGYKIAKIIGFNRSSISRELHRYKNPALYKAELAQMRADKLKANSGKPSKASNPEIMQNIERLIKRPDMPSPETLLRELASLEQMKDNFPKTILMLGAIPQKSHKGMQMVNVVDWLLK